MSIGLLISVFPAMTKERTSLCISLIGLGMLVVGAMIYVFLYLKVSSDVTILKTRTDNQWIWKSKTIFGHRNNSPNGRWSTLFYTGQSAHRSVARNKPSVTELTEVQKELELRLEAASETKIIIFWAPAFGVKGPIRPINRTICGQCEITYNRSLISDPRTGAVLYYFDSVNASDMPYPRNPNHLHIYWTMESFATMKHFRYTMETEDKYQMNATMTYRSDSHFITNYGSAGRIMNFMGGRNESVYQEIMSTKSKLAAVAISDCHVTPGAKIRLALINELKAAGLRIDTFGKCFSNFLNDLFGAIPKYKFYFSYENSHHCRDYITEKFFVYALQYNTVPVVWGATKEDYEMNAPAGSFIFAEDFDSPQSLIEYLEFLDKNDDEYLKYFKWRTEKLLHLPKESGFCSICRAMHGINVDSMYHTRTNNSASIPLFSDGVAKRTVSLRKFMYEEDNAQCFDTFTEILPS